MQHHRSVGANLFHAAIPLALLAAALQASAVPGDTRGSRDWPCWRGPRTNGTAGEIPPASELVEKPEDARLVWTSEAWIPPSGNNHMGKFTTGFASPCVSEGRVFLFWYEGDGKVVDPLVLERSWGGLHRGTPEAWKRKIASVVANEIVLCVDAATGSTLWKKVVGKGVNLQGSGSGKVGGHFSMAAADGMAFAYGTNGRAYCLEAKTGKLRWTAPTGITQKREQLLEQAVEAESLRGAKFGRTGGGGRSDLPNGCPAYADGVVWILDRAFDAETGKILWQGSHGNNTPSPVVWRHEGKAYFISGGGACVEPRTGKVLWTVPVRGGRPTPAIGGGYMVLGAATACYRITPAKAKLVWQVEGSGGSSDMGSSSVIHGGYLYANTSHPAGHRRERTKYGGAANHVCIELATGREICRIGARSNSGSLIACGPWVIQEGVHPQEEGKGIAGLGVYRADPARDTFGLVGALTCKGPFQDSVTPAVVGSRIYIRGGERLCCYDLRAKRVRAGRSSAVLDNDRRQSGSRSEGRNQ